MDNIEGFELPRLDCDILSFLHSCHSENMNVEVSNCFLGVCFVDFGVRDCSFEGPLAPREPLAFALCGVLCWAAFSFVFGGDFWVVFWYAWGALRGRFWVAVGSFF